MVGDGMNTKQYIAVAALLVIVMPIGLGYMLAFEEVERSGWVATDKTNFTDELLNYHTYYYNNSTSPMNNAEIITHNYQESETLIKAPDYIRISGNYSSLPVFEDITVPIVYDPIISTISVPGNGGSTQISGDQYAGDIGLINFTVPAISNDVTLWSLDRTDSAGFFPLTAEHIYRFARLSDSSIRELVEPFMLQPANVKYLGNISGGWISEYWGDSSLSLTVRSYRYVPIEVTADYYGEFTQFTDVKIVCDQGTIYAHGDSGRLQKYGSSLTLTLDGTTVNYTGVSSVSVASINNLFLTATGAATGEYADPAQGWMMPEDSGMGAYYDWINGQLNRSVVMYLQVRNGQDATYQVINGNAAASEIYIEHSSSGGMFVELDGERKTIGAYDYLQVIFYSDKVTIGGIISWPEMYQQPTVINRITLNYDTVLADGVFSGIRVTGDRTIQHRVDGAEIVAGTFPTTKDNSIFIPNFWPGKYYAFTIENVGIYGSSIEFGGRSYPVVDGKITIDLETGGTSAVKLTDAFFSAYMENGLWVYSINNHVQGEPVETAHDVGFSGVWSMGFFAYQVGFQTETVMEWVPGVFAFEGSDFAVFGLGCAALVFVALGLSGRASGSKMLALAIACGSLALIFLMMA